MLQSYFKIALRNLRKQGFYSFINIFGLSVGVAVCMVIALFVINESSYDKHFKDGDRIYRITNKTVFGGRSSHNLYTPAALVRALPEEIPEVESAVHFREQGPYLVKRPNDSENLLERRVIWTSKDFFKVFDLEMVSGTNDGILDEPGTIAISETIAEKYFPKQEAIGESLILDNDLEFRITGVYKDLPEASHFHFDFLLSAEGLQEAQGEVWFSNNFQTYFKAYEGASPEAIEEKFFPMLKKYMEPQLSLFFGEGTTFDDLIAQGSSLEYILQPIHDIHLKSDLEGEFEANFSEQYVYIFLAIGLFILLIACINFMNLSTAKSASRAKEVGIRKVMGSFRIHLIRQFLMESILLSSIAFLIAIPLASLMLPFFNDVAERNLTMPIDSIGFYAAIFLGAIVTGLIAGSYPAFFLSAFKPVSILKGKIRMGMKSGNIRSTLVVFQFAISVILIIATITVNNQLSFIQNREIGFEKDQLITVFNTYALNDRLVGFKDRVLADNTIEQATISGFLPVAGSFRSDSPWLVEGRDLADMESTVSIQNWQVDENYIPSLGMELVSGRNFSLDFPSDSSAVILNETAVKKFNFEGDPIGQKVYSQILGDGNEEIYQIRTVVGVVKDFNFQSMKESVSPVMLLYNKVPGGPVSFKFRAENTQNVIQLIEEAWKDMAPGQPLTYEFMDEQFSRMYHAETRLGKVFGVFAGFAIFIACLGLFALTAFTAEQRTKEIGIRKVLGATSSGIVVLLSKEFSKLVLIAFVLASPLAWWSMTKWLEDYEYKVNLGPSIFLLAGLFVAVIAFVTISLQAFKAASSNPVNSLKSE
ncbi:ABC transporter permease [Algoriphagus sediminis]|uniref:ABC transporter permease n=1 Tax=Algoriphagus sediminis TaxID=3057113 RepID=A0ABT7Y9X4_9BACT|nr:ABC transporter permease [Algoriphagus sediminis]MDN3203315.1 ABC transporter permease [Algoriphagus sediminis]